uniref:NUC153 domain-containing protein n=1 Tax=Trichuris muris TaxID=70415 RepID=A0A5S6R026_TRIMR
MLVTYPNDVKIYNLSAGKTLPDWLSERKRRRLLKKNVDLRRRIELIQDFGMPDASHAVVASVDRNYIYAAGTYKPRIRCYDVRDLSMKFERCIDSDVIKMKILSEGYEKVVMLEENRWLEFHVQYGHYFKTRIPKFGRDIAYVESKCELYAVGASPDIYRLNLELGQFMPSLVTSGSSILSCDISPEHSLFVCGTDEGNVEAWDPRSKGRIGTLDTLSSLGNHLESKFGISCLKFKDPLHLAVGTEGGHVLLYDIRSTRPYVTKDNMYGLPIKAIAFNRDPEVVLSMDPKILKIWYESTSKPYTSIEPNVRLNDLCLLPDSGLLFMANDKQKILTYYIPNLGPAPRWCSFLDNITEELEETTQSEVFDDYKFVTVRDLDQLGLSNLIGTSLLRAYMHGYFMDARLYNKAKETVNPFAFDEYRRQKVREKLDEERKNRVKLNKQPVVNKELAERLIIEQGDVGRRKKKSSKKSQLNTAEEGNLLTDNRFKALFEKSDFQIDPSSEEYKLLNPAVARLQNAKREKMRRLKERAEQKRQDRLDRNNSYSLDEAERVSDNSSVDVESESGTSSEEDAEFVQSIKETYREMRRAGQGANRKRNNEEHEEKDDRFGVVELTDSIESFDWSRNAPTKQKQTTHRLSMEERMLLESGTNGSFAFRAQGREMVVQLGKEKAEERDRQRAAHLEERKQARRSITSLTGPKKRTMRGLR